MKTLLLFSGGLDSTTLLAYLISRGHEVTTLSFRYGSLHQEAEMEAAEKIIKFYGVPHLNYELDKHLFDGGSSALLGQSEMPDEAYQNVDLEGPSATVVPFRNGIMIANAVAIANSRGIEQVAVAAHATDSARWSYPDCSPEFMGAMTAAAYVGTHHEVRLMAPLIWLTKDSIVKMAAQLCVPVALTWSCYHGKDKACGVCPTCRERIAAFHTAGYVDPIDYEIPINWFNCRPWQLHLYH